MSEMTGPAATQMFDVLAPGTMLGRNELLATIGEGGMARVILARQRGPMGFEKVVVVKVIHPDFAADSAAVGMLLDEARVAARIDHPNVVQTYELGEASGSFYIVMEYLAGESLQRVLKSVSLGASFDPRMAARIVADAAGGLHAAHELCDTLGNNLGLIHRDVSLGNIVVLYNGCVKVVDFGIAKSRDRVSNTTQRGQLKGKYAYMSPEQINDDPMDRRSDVFSLGVVLWECLAQRRLFHADNVPGILMQILDDKRIPPSHYCPNVPRALDDIALRALQTDPDKRFATAYDMKRALEDVIWESRCDSSDVHAWMTAVFGDRMRKRQALLAQASTARPSSGTGWIEPRDARFDETSALHPPLPRRIPTSPPQPRRSWLGGMIVAIGVMVGVALGVRLIGGQFGNAESEAANRPTLATLPAIEPRAKPPAAPTAAHAQPADIPVGDRIPTDGVRLRPEHLEPIRIERQVARTTVPETATAPTPPVDTGAKAVARAPAVHTRSTAAVADTEPNDAPSMKELYASASTKFLAGDFVGAATVFKQAIARDQSYAPAHRGLGLAYQRMGLDALAVTSFRRYLALSPGAVDATSIRRRIEQLNGGDTN